MQATTQLDSNARSNSERPLRKGELVIVKQTPTDLWQSTAKVQSGLVAEKKKQSKYRKSFFDWHKTEEK